MKKLLGSTLALALLVPAGANAEILKNLKVSGQLDVQADSANNVTDFATRPSANGATPNNDHIGAAFSRLMVSADWDLLDDVHSRISIVKGANNLSATRTYGSGAQTVNTAALTSTFVEEANVKIDKLFGAIDTRIGRQFFGESGDLIAFFGAKDNYGLNVTALDAFRFDWSGEKFGLTGLAGVTSNTTGLATDSATTDLRALVGSFRTESVNLALSVYNAVGHAIGGSGVSPSIGSAGGTNDNLYIIDVKGKVTLGGLMAKVELAKDLGQSRGAEATEQNSAYSGWAAMANVAFKADLGGAGTLTPWGEFGYGSGRSRANSNHNDGFVALATDYRPGGIYGRFDNTAATTLGSAVVGNASSNGLANRTIYGLGVKMTPGFANKLTIGVQGYKYAFTRTSDTGVFGNTQYSRNIGTEGDVTAEWKHSENVALKLTLGQFLPGAYFADAKGAIAEINPATLVALDTTIRF